MNVLEAVETADHPVRDGSPRATATQSPRISPEGYEVIAASSFPEERRQYYLALAEEAEVLRCFLALEAEAERAYKRTQGARASCILGTSPAEAPLWEVLIYSPAVAVRSRAWQLLRLARRRQQETAP